MDWSKVDKDDYLLATERSPIKDVEIKVLLKNRQGGEHMEQTDLYAAQTVYPSLYGGAVYAHEELDPALIFGALPDAGEAFTQGVLDRLSQLGETVDADGLLPAVRRRILARTGERCPKAVENWLRGGVPGTTSRANHYLLCYALEMDTAQTAEFFARCFFTLPFNYKDCTDAVFYYGLLRQKPYAQIRSMLDRAQQFPCGSLRETGTLQIRERIRSIRDDETFLRYLSAHCFNNERQFQTAREAIRDMAQTVRNDLGAQSMSALHAQIMGFNYQRKKREGGERARAFPKQYTQSLPTDGVLAAILNGERETYDTLRKTLVIFKLFDFYSFLLQAQEDTIPPQEVREAWYDFYAETNALLQSCAFAPLYALNAFDRAVLFCANSPDPPELFRELNAQRYG